MLAWMTHTDPKNSVFPNALQKWPNRGWYGSEGVFSYPPCKNRTQARTGGTAGAIRFFCQLILQVSSFSSPFQKVLFFVYVAQFWHEAILPLRSPNNVP